MPDGTHGWARRIAQRRAGRKVPTLDLPAVRWCMSPPESRLWSARYTWGSGGYPRVLCPPHVVLVSSGHPVVGGLVLINAAAPGRQLAGYQRLRGNSLRRGRRGNWLGRGGMGRNGQPSVLARFPERSRDWWPSLRPPDLSRPAGLAHRPACRRDLLPDGCTGQSALRLRRLPRRLRRPRCGRTLARYSPVSSPTPR